ncbi:MAG: GNAT family N-acetyltransferase [Chloroflexi bacterium]|nr:GNAT family N-acetyltransferase [Chloroflexota bacterium]
MIRPIRPTDLLALTSFYRVGFRNEACTAGNPNHRRQRDASLSVFLEQWLSLEENRHTWIALDGQRIAGLISAHGLVGETAWEIDRLLVGIGVEDLGVAVDLLDYLAAVAAEVGVHRLFLRVHPDGPVVDLARRADFRAFLVEALYWRELGERVALPAAPGFVSRRQSASDEWQAFRLYNQVAPSRVRQAEGLTLQEWRQVRERIGGQRRRREYVVERDGRLIAWFQTCTSGGAGHFDLLVDGGFREVTADLVRFCLVYLAGRSPVTCLVPEYQSGLGSILEETGFTRAAEYASMVRQVTVRVRRPVLVPARA